VHEYSAKGISLLEEKSLLQRYVKASKPLSKSSPPTTTPKYETQNQVMATNSSVPSAPALSGSGKSLQGNM